MMRTVATTRRLTLHRRWLVLAAGLGIATAAIGWMHTPAARPWLAKLGVPCPVNHASATQVAALRSEALPAVRGTARAPLRPALGGLVLDSTRYTEALQWQRAQGLHCEEVQHGARFLRCRGFEAAAVGLGGPPISEMWLSFDPHDRLIGVDVYRRGLDRAAAVQAWQAPVDRLARTLGPATQSIGAFPPAGDLPLQVARVQYRYADYLATVSGARLPHAGLAVREQYVSLM